MTNDTPAPGPAPTLIDALDLLAATMAIMFRAVGPDEAIEALESQPDFQETLPLIRDGVSLGLRQAAVRWKEQHPPQTESETNHGNDPAKIHVR